MRWAYVEGGAYPEAVLFFLAGDAGDDEVILSSVVRAFDGRFFVNDGSGVAEDDEATAGSSGVEVRGLRLTGGASFGVYMNS